MKTHLKQLLIILAASGLTAGAAVSAEPPAGAAGMEEPGHRGPGGGDWAEFRAFKLEKLHTDLKLNPTQENAWKEWSGKINAGQQEWEKRRGEFASWGNLTVPERMEKALDFAKQRVARLEERLAATKSFYAILSPEQRQIFDKEFGFGPHGRYGKFRHH